MFTCQVIDSDIGIAIPSPPSVRITVTFSLTIRYCVKIAKHIVETRNTFTTRPVVQSFWFTRNKCRYEILANSFLTGGGGYRNSTFIELLATHD